MSVLWEDKKGTILYSKGAPESILPLCDLSSAQLEEFTKNYERLAKKGLRVLAVAYKRSLPPSEIKVNQKKRERFRKRFKFLRACRNC